MRAAILAILVGSLVTIPAASASSCEAGQFDDAQDCANQTIDTGQELANEALDLVQEIAHTVVTWLSCQECIREIVELTLRATDYALETAQCTVNGC